MPPQFMGMRETQGAVYVKTPLKPLKMLMYEVRNIVKNA